ncbi:hypothetical protein P8452_71504 [Trifolium repens]|nr:hypothetical protein P8452_71504 [Trifolium repens]
MINYMDKMGKRSPFLTGKYKRPSLRDWDVKTANQDLQKVHELMGLENGLTAGVKRLNSTEDVPVVICFDADTCPLSKAEEHLNYCRGCIEVYSTAAKTLQRRIGEANASTSGKLEPTPIDKAHKSEGEETDTSSTEKSPKNLSSFNAVQAQGEPSNPNPSTEAENRYCIKFQCIT